MAHFTFDRSFPLPVDAATYWDTICDLEAFPRWWPWLARFSVTPRANLEAGVTAECVIQPPLPYSLHVVIDVLDVEPEHRVGTIVTGDIAGPASLEIVDEGATCRARLRWELELGQPVLRAAATVLRPIMQYGHDRVVAAGFASFVDRALTPVPPAGGGAD